ncbi:MAG: hypothetical protein ACFB15_08080 [Cyclobacteriaceae bacterium]
MNQRDKNLQNLHRSIRRLLPSQQGNLKVVILCIIAATTFWFFSALNKEDYTTRIRYPVRFSYPSDSAIYLLSELPRDITVQITGGGWDLLKKSLRVNTSPLTIDLDTPTETKFILGQSLAEPISTQLDNVRLDYVVTDTLRINIDSLVRRNIIVALNTQSLRLAENYRLVSEVSVLPAQIEVGGPVSVVQQLPDTLKVQLEDEEVEGKLETTLPVPIDDERLKVYPDEVMVNLAAELYTRVERRTTLTPVNFPEDSSVYLSQDFITVSFWLPDDLISPALSQLPFQAEADLQSLNENDSTVAVNLVDIPAIASDISISHSRIPVTYAP